MERCCKHFGGRSRILDLVPPVASVGVLPRKTNWIHETFQSFNFSFILEGSGEYYWQQESHKVEAPMIITQWPGEKMKYGPTVRWVEIYAIYPPAQWTRWRNAGVDITKRPFWKVHDFQKFNRLIGRLLELIHQEEADAFEVDMCLARLIGASLLPGSEEDHAEKLRHHRELLQENLTQKPDYPKLAHQLGMSESTLRRRWLSAQNAPPGRDRSQWQREKACRLLVESSWPIKRIAEECGFSDPFYFSRRFRMWMGDTPSDYRKKYAAYGLAPMPEQQ